MSVIVPLSELPDGLLAELVAESEQAGFRFVRKLVNEWVSGANRFAAPGEVLFAARIDGQVVGVGGLNIDPYTNESRVGRVRHLYVLSAYRRMGIGRSLVERIMAAARDRFSQLRLRTDTSEAARFYEALGFQPCLEHKDCSHMMELK